MTPADHRATVVRFYELMNARRFEEMWALFADDAVWSGGGNPPARVSPIARMREIIVDPMPIFVTGGIDFTLHSMTAEDDRTALLVSEIPVRRRSTLYAVMGDAFGFACCLVFVVIIGFALTRSKASVTDS